MKNQSENNWVSYPGGSQAAPDPKNVSKMLEWLYALNLTSGNDVERKMKSLTSGFLDPAPRQIATEAAHFVKSESEKFSARRKANQKKEFESPSERAQRLKENRLKGVSRLRYSDEVYFLSPKGAVEPDFARDAFVGTSRVKNTPSKINLLSAFDDVMTTNIERHEKEALCARLESELENGTFSPAEMAEAKALVEQNEQLVRKEHDQWSIENEHKALQEIFNLACVYILKYAASEDLSACRSPESGQFIWNRSSIDVEHDGLLTHGDDFKTRAHGVASGTPARVAMRQFELDVLKYEWFIGLVEDRVMIPQLVSQFKSLLVSKLESLLDARDAHLRNMVAADPGVAARTKSKFDFYKFHLSIGAVAPPLAPTVRFLDGESGNGTPKEGADGSPDNFVGAMGASSSRPLSGKPNAKCTGETRKEKYSKETSVEHTYEPRSEDDADPSSSEAPDARASSRSKPFKGREDRSGAPSTRKNKREPEPKTGGPRTRADSDVIRLLGDLTQKLDRVVNQPPRGRPTPAGDPLKKKRVIDVVVPDNACRSFKAGKPCHLERCGGNHGKYSNEYKGRPSRICINEKNGSPCPYLWTVNGCYSKHTAKNE